ncbi:MAG: hypothetical protein M0Z68_11305 [Gammaproteobacteria bacterium]|nr:hypothetical protein [Gammaproteobacteria bacterium]
MAQDNRSLLQALDDAPVSFFHMRAHEILRQGAIPAGTPSGPYGPHPL